MGSHLIVVIYYQLKFITDLFYGELKMSNVEFFKEQEEFEFNHFERIVNPKSLRQDVCAILILDSLIPSGNNLIQSIESYNDGNLMYFILNVSDVEIEELLTEDDIVDLLRCGVFYDHIS